MRLTSDPFMEFGKNLYLYTHLNLPLKELLDMHVHAVQSNLYQHVELELSVSYRASLTAYNIHKVSFIVGRTQSSRRACTHCVPFLKVLFKIIGPTQKVNIVVHIFKYHDVM